LRAKGGTSARALEFAILTAARTGEITGATWGEIDLEAREWKIPAGRMKGSREHRVPLSTYAVELLQNLPREENNEFVFLGRSRGLSAMSLASVLQRMGRPDITVHGFRSTFRDWCAETTNYPNHVTEMALAHNIGNKVEAAYRRGDLFAKRARLMQQWSEYCSRPVSAGSIISLRSSNA
jgi:integrase